MLEIIILIAFGIFVAAVYVYKDDSSKIEIVKKQMGKKVSFVMTTYAKGFVKDIKIFSAEALRFYFKRLEEDIQATKNNTRCDLESGKRISR